jgi:hypothetical protein
MTHRTASLLVVALVIIFAGQCAVAQQPQAAPAGTQDGPAASSAEQSILAGLTDILPPQAGRSVCYSRRYDDVHLARHPRQQVASMVFLLRVANYDFDKAAPPEKLEDRVHYQFAMTVKRRGERRTLRTAGDCFGGDGISCAVDCDGGSAAIEKVQNVDALMVRLSNERGIRMYGDCDGEAVWLKPGSDDKAFRLDKSPPEACRALQRTLAQ